MFNRIFLMASVAAMAGCSPPARNEKSPSSEPSVNQTKSTPQKIDLQSISFADIEAQNLFAAGCNFMLTERNQNGLVLIAEAERATFKSAGKFHSLRPARDSEEMPYASRAKYEGDGFVLTIVRPSGKGSQVGEETRRWKSNLTIRDAHGEEVYKSDGELECGA